MLIGGAACPENAMRLRFLPYLSPAAVRPSLLSTIQEQ
jgi:hypothetical protein